MGQALLFVVSPQYVRSELTGMVDEVNQLKLYTHVKYLRPINKQLS